MSKESWWLAAKIVIGLPLVFFVLLSVLEPQRVIWRKPTKRVLTVFLVAWGAVLCFIVFALVWNTHR